MDEFGLIARYFAPLAKGHAAGLELKDDAAILNLPGGQELVVTKDAISEGIHFLGTEDASLIARKLLRSNLSDLAAMGATPLVYFLAGILPRDTEESWIEDFAKGLARDQQEFAIHLAGGDTVMTKGTLSLSLTALGTVPTGQALRRNGAKPGDRIFVSGTLGDSALGLAFLQKRIGGGNAYLEQRYFLPEPRLTLGQRLRGIANAAMDISDGLLQDLSHICAASHVSAVVRRDAIPLSPAARNLIAEDAVRWDYVLAGGDDYELLFTVPESKIGSIPEGCTCIGEVMESSGITLLDSDHTPLPLPAGFRHFS